MRVLLNHTVILDPSQRVKFYFRINRTGVPQTVTFDEDISAEIWQFNVKKRPFDSTNEMQLTVGDGITLNGMTLTLAPTAEKTENMKQMKYYCELYNVTRKQTWLSGPAYFTFGDFDAVTL